MAGKNDDVFDKLTNRDLNFVAFCNELRAYVEEHGLFPPKHTNMLSRIKYVRKKIKAGTLEDCKREMFEEIEKMRDLSIHTGGRKKKSSDEQ